MPFGRETGRLRHRGKSEVAESGSAVVGEPHIARLHVAMNCVVCMRVRERGSHVGGDLDRTLEGKAVVRAGSQEPLDIAAGQMLADDERSSVLVTDVVHGDEIGMVAETAHGARLAADAIETRRVEPFGLDDRECHRAIEPGVVGPVDALA